jgi:hypothetical protein
VVLVAEQDDVDVEVLGALNDDVGADAQEHGGHRRSELRWIIWQAR